MAPSQYVLPNEQPFCILQASEAFAALSEQEKLYAHYLSRASFYGGLIVLIQTSPESPQIFRLLHRMNGAQSVDELKATATESGLSEEDFLAFLVYCSGVYANMGNYKGFGDSKIIPNIVADRFEALVRSSKAWADDRETMEVIWSSCKDAIYSLTDKEKQLGLADKGVSTYFSANCEQVDADRINRFFKAKQIEGYINRAFKTTADGKTRYEIRNAGGAQSTTTAEEFEGADFAVTTGDYRALLQLVNANLLSAQRHASNDLEKSMLAHYVESFGEGSLAAHKAGSRDWIKNKGPVIETYIGFIETYRDPVGMRGEFEGFVAMVNKEQSAKFQDLVNNAETYLTLLPWPKAFEKDRFLRPDFTSLDVLSFAGSGIPAGINIPNYDEIRQEEGFKNVNLGNVITSSYKTDKDKKSPFVSTADHELFEKYRVPSFEVQVGLHELLGHGSGKLLQRSADGAFNFDAAALINPLTNTTVDKWYEPGETYDSQFTSLGSSYEECRAECVGLYLSCDRAILAIFGHTDDDVCSDVLYTNWLSLLHAAVRGLEMFSPSSGEWKQAHSQARFVILQVLMEAGQGFVDVKEVAGEDGQPDLLLTMDRSKLESVGRPAIGSFLTKLQVLKSTGDVEAAKTMFDGYSEVTSGPWIKWRDIILERKQPRKILVQANTQLPANGGAPTLLNYPDSAAGMVQSWTERFSPAEAAEVDKILHELYLADQPYFGAAAAGGP